MSTARALVGRVEAPVRLGLALLLGVLVAVQVKLAIVAAGAALLGVLGFSAPPMLVGGMYAGMLFDRLGATGSKLGDFPITASKLTVLGSIGLWAVRSLITRERLFRWHPVYTSMLGMMAGMAVSIAWNDSLEHGKFPLYGLGMMMMMMLLIHAILAEVPLEPLVRFLAVVLLAALVAGMRHPFVEGAEGRESGTMGDPNEWATTIVLLSPVLLGVLVDDPHPLARPLRMGLVALAPLGVLRSESRAALVVTAAILPGCLYLMRRRRGEVLACLVGAVLAAPVVIDLDLAFDRFWNLVGSFQGSAPKFDESFEERSELFRQAVQLFADNWIIGAGPGMFESATGFVSHLGTLRPAHNTYLEIASEQGIVGLIPTSFFMATVAWTLHGAWMGATRERDRNRVLGAALGLGAFALMAATLGLFTFAMGWLVLGIVLAIVHQAHRPDVVAG